MFGFNGTDVFLALLAVYLIVRGCMRGITGEVVSLIGFILACFSAFKYSGVLSLILQERTEMNGCFAQISAMVIIWLSVTLTAVVLRRMLRKTIAVTNLRGLDTILGVLSGVLKFAVLVYCIIIAGFMITPVCNPCWMTDSDILRYAGREWPLVKKTLVKHNLLLHADLLPDGTLEQALRPYRTGQKSPR